MLVWSADVLTALKGQAKLHAKKVEKIDGVVEKILRSFVVVGGKRSPVEKRSASSI